MGTISNVTSGKLDVNTNISQNDTTETVFSKAYFEKNQDENTNKSNGETLNIDKDNVQLNNSNIQVEKQSNNTFLQIDNNISGTQIQAITRVLNEIPSSMIDYMMKEGLTIKIYDLSLEEFTQMKGYENRTDPIGGLYSGSRNTIEMPNWKTFCETTPSLYKSTMHAFAHEIGHYFDKICGRLSNSTDFINALQMDKEYFLNEGKNGEFVLTFPFEGFADSFSHFIQDDFLFEKNCPNIWQYFSNAMENFEKYLNPNDNTSYSDFFKNTNPNTDMETHEYNKNVYDKGAYKKF